MPNKQIIEYDEDASPDRDTSVFLKQDTTGGIYNTVTITKILAALLVSDIPNLSTDKLTSGILGLDRGGTGVDLSTSGDTNHILAQDASHTVSARALTTTDIPDLSTDKLTSGTLDLDRGGTGVDLSSSGAATHVLAQDASHNISARALVAADIPNLSTDKLTSGTLSFSRLPVGTPNRNALINGAFSVWQRQNDPTTFTEYSDDTYCADRWYALTEANAIDCKLIDGDSQRFALQMKQKNASSQRFGVAQIIEGINCKHLRGQTVSVAARVRCSSSATVCIAVLEWTGTEDSLTSDIVSSWAATPTWIANISSPGTKGEVACPNNTTWYDLKQEGITLGSTFNNLVVIIWTEDQQAQDMTLDIEAAYLVAGNTADRFMPRLIGEELTLCQRYLYVPDNGCSGVREGTRYITSFILRHKVTMRTAPTLSDNVSGWGTGATEVRAFDYAANAYVTITGNITVGLNSSSIDTWQISYVAGTSFSGTAGSLCWMQVGSGVKMLLSAEL